MNKWEGIPYNKTVQICIINRLKGFSTVLAGGDPLEYASLLIQTGRADHVLAGSVEEYFPPLYEAFSALDAAKGTELSEGAAMAVLSGRRTEITWCRLSAFAGVNLGKSPLISRLEDPAGAEEKITGVIQQMGMPDSVFTTANGSWFDEMESRAIRRTFPDVPQQHPKEFFGETLGCGYMMNVLLAAASVRSGICSRGLKSLMKKRSCKLVNLQITKQRPETKNHRPLDQSDGRSSRELLLSCEKWKKSIDRTGKPVMIITTKNP